MFVIVIRYFVDHLLELCHCLTNGYRATDQESACYEMFDLNSIHLII